MLYSRKNKRRVVVTSIGVVAPNGNDTEAYTQALKDGKSGIDFTTHFKPDAFVAKLASEVKNFPFQEYITKYPELAKIKDLKIFYGLKAFEETLEKALLSPEDLKNTGFIAGTSLETFYINSLTEFSPNKFELDTFMTNYFSSNQEERIFLQTPINFLGEFLLNKFKLKGPIYTNCSACTASTQAIGRAYDIISSGREKLLFSGGFDSLINPLGIGGFSVLGALNTDNEMKQEASRPFDARRKGIVIGEGSAFFLLEDLEHAINRGANILGEILGHNSTLDAYKFSSPHPDGEGIAKAMEKALLNSGLAPKNIDYINAHGTSTILNDVMETKAIKTIFGENAYNIPISSIKSMLGHLVGASGAVEIAGCFQMIRDSFISPTINLKVPDPECDLNYVPNQAIKKEITYILKNSMGFGGQNSTIILGKYT